MLTRILCWFGLHAWAYAFGWQQSGPMQERRCYRCPVVQAPYQVSLKPDEVAQAA